MQKKIIIAGIYILVALLAACAFPGARPNPVEISQEDAINTAAARTVAAIGTSIAEGKNPTLGVPLPDTGATATLPPAPTSATTGTPALTQTNTPRPRESGTPADPDTPCNRADFVGDITIQDGSKILANSIFTKTWELKNSGTCSWDSTYSVVFAGRGSSMSGPASTALVSSGEVKPGESALVTVSLRAPNDPGEYKGFWMLRSGDGQVFGTGAKGGSPFYVQIHVSEEFHFAEQLCSAKWSTGGGDLTCPGKESDNQGYVVSVENPTLENNEQVEGLGFLVAAQPAPNGYIVGRFPPVMVPDQSDFRATLSCQKGAEGCYVRFKVTYQVDNGEEQVLGEWNEGYEGGVTQAVKDLDMLSGRSAAFNFYVYVAGTPDKSKAVWFDPRIVK